MERDRFGDARRPEHGSNNGQRVEVEAPSGDRRQAAEIRRYGMMTCTGLMIASAGALAVLFLKPYMPSTPFRFLFSLLAKGGLVSGLALATGSLVCLLAANLRSRLEMDVPETGCATGTGPGTCGATPGTVSDTRRKPLRPRRELPDLVGWLYNLADLGFLKWWYFVGTFILLAGVIGLVTWQWNAIGGYFVFFTVLAVTVGFYLLAYYLAERARIGSSIVFIIASALVPVSFYVFNHFKIAGRSFDLNVMGIACSLIAAAVYALNSYRSRNQVMFAFTMLTGLSLLFFILRASGTSVHFWGPWFAGAAALYFIAGYVMKRAGLDSCSKTMFAVGNAGIAMGLLTTIGDIEYFVGPGLKTSGILLMSSAAALLIGSYTYDDRVLAYVSSGLILASSFFMAREPGTAWCLTAPAITAAAGILLALGLADRLLVEEHDGGPFVYSGVAALLGIVGVTAGKDAVFNIPRLWRESGRPEVLSSLVTAAMAACLMWAAAIVQRKKALGYLAFAITVYASLVGLGYCVYDLPIYIARSFTHTVYTYMFAWALVFSCAALVLGRLDPDGGRFRFLSEPLAWAGLAYLASGTGVATWVATHRYAPVALALSGLGAMLAAAFLGTRGRIAEWMERPVWLGSILVGTAAVSCSLQSSSWSMYYGNVLSIAALTACIFMIGAARRQKAFFVTASCVYGTASLGSFIYYSVSNPTLTPATGGWQIVSLFSIAALAIGCSFYLDDVFAHAAGHVFAAIGLIALGYKLDLYPQHAGYWLAGAGALFSFTAFASNAIGKRGFATAGWLTSAGLLAGAIVRPMAVGQVTEAIVTIAISIGISAASAAAYRKDVLAYVPLALSMVETAYVLATRRPYFFPITVSGLIFLGPAILYLGAAWLFREKSRRLSDVLLQAAAAFTVVGTIAQLVAMRHVRADWLVVATFFTAASIYAAIGMLKEFGWMAHLSFANFFLGYAMVLADRHVSSQYAYLYCMPIGLYIIFLGYWAERAGREKRLVQLLHGAGFTILALSSFIPSLGEKGRFSAAVLLTMSLASIGVAFRQRRKVFLASGLIFIVITGIVRLWSPAGALPWSVYAVIVGALILIGGILFERKWDLFVDKGAQVRQTLRDVWR